MKCRFCAEEIKADAVVCRYCGAVKEGGEWKAPPIPSARPPRPAVGGSFTIRTAGVLFVLSAVGELTSMSGEIPLFGALRGGAIAAVYHLVYVALFLAMGVGLLTARRWGYWSVIVGTVYYTLDRSLYLLDRPTLEAQLMQQLQGHDEIFEWIDKDSMVQITVLTTMLFIACWWGFALYLHLRRGYFRK